MEFRIQFDLREKVGTAFSTLQRVPLGKWQVGYGNLRRRREPSAVFSPLNHLAKTKHFFPQCLGFCLEFSLRSNQMSSIGIKCFLHSSLIVAQLADYTLHKYVGFLRAGTGSFWYMCVLGTGREQGVSSPVSGHFVGTGWRSSFQFETMQLRFYFFKRQGF